MYLPAAFADGDLAAMVKTARSIGFGHLVVAAGEIRSTPLPFLIAVDGDDVRIHGHLARGNDTHAVAPCEAMLLVAGVDAYVSPSMYPSKQLDGKAVPTWNYEVVHLHGHLVAHDDRQWLLQHVRALSDYHEAGRAEPWSVDDAPAAYIDKLAGAIVGIELQVTRWECKRKLSQNRADVDRLGVQVGLAASDRSRDQELAAAMNR